MKKTLTSKSRANRKALLDIMEKHSLNSTEIGAMMEITPQAVRLWRSGGRAMPNYALKFLNLLIAQK